MSYRITFPIATYLLLTCGMSVEISRAADSPQADRQQSRATLLDHFTELSKNTRQAVGSISLKQGGRSKEIDDRDLAASLKIKSGRPIDTLERAPALAVRLWGRLIDDQNEEGPHVNLASYSWAPGRRFRLYVESAVPIQLGIFQSRADGSVSTISPHPDHPETYKPIMPGRNQPWKSDILVLDADHEVEEITFVMVRVDACCLRGHGAREALDPTTLVLVHNTTTVVTGGQDGTPQAVAESSVQVSKDEARKQIGEDLKGLAKIIYSKTKGIAEQKAYSLMKMQYESTAEMTRSDQPNDVALVQLGLGNIGFLRIFFTKPCEATR